jgi:hypothetical protein
MAMVTDVYHDLQRQRLPEIARFTPSLIAPLYRLPPFPGLLFILSRGFIMAELALYSSLIFEMKQHILCYQSII